MLSWQPDHPGWDAPGRLSIITEEWPKPKDRKQAGMAVFILCPETGTCRKLGGTVIGEGTSWWGKGPEGSCWRNVGRDLGLVTEQGPEFGFADLMTVQRSFKASIQDLATGKVLRVWNRHLMCMYGKTGFPAEWAACPNGDQVGVFMIPTDSGEVGGSGRSCRDVIALTFRRSQPSDRLNSTGPWETVKEARLGNIDQCRICPTGSYVTGMDKSSFPDAFSFVQIDMDSRRKHSIISVHVDWSYEVAWVPGYASARMTASARSPPKNMMYVVSGCDGVVRLINASLHACVWKWEAGSVLSKVPLRCQPRKVDPVWVDRYPNEWRMHKDDIMAMVKHRMENKEKYCICEQCAKAKEAPAPPNIETKITHTPDGKLTIAAHDTNGRCCIASVCFG